MHQNLRNTDQLLTFEIFLCCQTPGLVLSLRVDFVLPLSQEQQELEQEATKIYQKEVNCRSGILHIDLTFLKATFDEAPSLMEDHP